MSAVDEYPPLADITEKPLHANGLPAACHWACHEPERPFNLDLTWYDWRCRACVRHAEATVATVGDIVMAWSNVPGGMERNTVPLSWLVARSKHWLGML